MADPVTMGHFITGLVSLLSAYMTYKVGMANAQRENKPIPVKNEEAVKGEKVALVVETAILQHGRDDEKTALAVYQQNPKLFETSLIQAIKDIASRSPEFAAQLAALAQQENIGSNSSQIAIGSHIAQAIQGSSASVNVNVQKDKQ